MYKVESSENHHIYFISTNLYIIGKLKSGITSLGGVFLAFVFTEMKPMGKYSNIFSYETTIYEWLPPDVMKVDPGRLHCRSYPDQIYNSKGYL